MPPSFLYFDVGNVLLTFDHHAMCRDMAYVAGVTPEQMWAALFDSGLEWEYEAGRIGTGQFIERLSDALKCRLDPAMLAEASSRNFVLNVALVPIVSQLRLARHRLGLLSNTNAMHWEQFSDGRYCVIPSLFEAAALSFQIGALKPEPEIYRAAAELARVPAQEIFFVDDVAAHVAGARAAGFDAAHYTTAAALAVELRQRGLRWNY